MQFTTRFDTLSFVDQAVFADPLYLCLSGLLR